MTGANKNTKGGKALLFYFQKQTQTRCSSSRATGLQTSAEGHVHRVKATPAGLERL